MPAVTPGLELIIFGVGVLAGGLGSLLGLAGGVFVGDRVCFNHTAISPEPRLAHA